MAKDKQQKLARATANVLDDPSQSRLVFTSSVDQMELPTKYGDLIKLCRFYYKHDPIAGTVINKMVDCAISPLRNRRANCEDDECWVYDSLLDMLQEFFRNVCLEYLLSGLVIPHYEWVRKKGSELHPELNSRTRFVVPDNIWFRDPATIRVKASPIPNRKKFYVEVSAELIYFIKHNGKYPDGTEDKETYDLLVKNYPEFVKAVKALRALKLEVELTEVRPILSRCLPEDSYPIPYMENALESLMHKRNLRKMDYSIAARVTAAIQLIKLGNDLFPTTDEKDFDAIKAQMNVRNIKGQSERLFQLFANHTLEIEWVHPDTAAMLNQEKYRSVEDDIIAGLGFPRTLITGESLRSNVSGGSDLATFSPIATMEAIRDKLVEWTKELYKEVKERNKFKGAPIPRFESMRLYKLIDLDKIGMGLYMEGSLSRTSRLEAQGYDLETELERKKDEEAKYKEYGLESPPLMPYSSPNLNTPKTPNKPKTKEPTKEE